MTEVASLPFARHAEFARATSRPSTAATSSTSHHRATTTAPAIHAAAAAHAPAATTAATWHHAHPMAWSAWSAWSAHGTAAETVSAHPHHAATATHHWSQTAVEVAAHHSRMHRPSLLEALVVAVRPRPSKPAAVLHVHRTDEVLLVHVAIVAIVAVVAVVGTERTRP